MRILTGWNFLTYFINIVVPGTVPAFAAGLRKLMTDVDSRESLGNSARDYCAAHYSREKILDQWEEALKAGGEGELIERHLRSIRNICYNN